MITHAAHRRLAALSRLCLTAGAVLTLAACSGPQSTQRETPPNRAPFTLAPERYDARLTGVDYPFPVKFHRFEAQRQKLEMAYMDIRPDHPNGQAVLLLHGKNFNGAYWARTAQDLSDRGYRVIAPDQIGFGKSSKPESFQYSFGALATFTNDLLDEIGVGEVAVVGHSMGGMVASRFALMFPDRTSKLALVNPIGLEDWQRVVPYATVDQWYQGELRKTPQSVRDYMRASYFDGAWEPEYDQLAALQMNWTLSDDRHQLAWVSALTYDMIFTQPVIHEFDQISAPTLLIIGVRDRTALGKNKVSPEVRETLGRYEQLGREAAAMIPDAQLVELQGVGHMPQIEAYDNYLAALADFLND